jgi:hypothetical protein
MKAAAGAGGAAAEVAGSAVHLSQSGTRGERDRRHQACDAGGEFHIHVQDP